MSTEYDSDVTNGRTAPKSIVRFSGECRGCGKHVQATIEMMTSSKSATAGGRVRCSDCGTTNYYEREDIPREGTHD